MEHVPGLVQRVATRRGPSQRMGIAIVIMLIAAVLAVTASPANAGSGAPTTLGVQPVEVALGGQPNDCTASISGRLPSAADHELRINNPQNGVTYTGAGGVSITLAVGSNDKNFDFVLAGPAVVFDVIVKGGQKSTHFDYDTNGGSGAATADQNLHGPTKGNGSNLYSISHVSFCYQEVIPASGSVYVDANQNGTRDSGEVADAPRVITAYGTSAVSTTSATDGSYTLLLQPGASYTICEEEIADHVQTAPANTLCTELGTSEPGGHVVATIAAPVPGLDFGNAPVICGQILFASSGIFSGDFELFVAGNDETVCENKIGQLSVTDGGGIPQVNLPLQGAGTVAGIGIITKTFTLPSAFVPLTYSRTTNTGYVVLPWCGLRGKTDLDGNQFDPYLTTDTMYPSLAGVTDTGAGGVLSPSVSCKVHEAENAEGIQTTVVLIQDDPFWR